MATTPLNEAEIIEKLQSLNDWKREGNIITKTYKFDHYLAGIAFASAVGTISEGFDHHPDLYIGWRKVQVSFTTHDAGNKLSHKDFKVAALIDTIPYPKSS
jgi:4a-hydroxytetrahydrobiopterin dehydratase